MNDSVAMEQAVPTTPKSVKKVTWSPAVSVYMIEKTSEAEQPNTPLSRTSIQRSLGIVSDDEEDDEILKLCGWDDDAVLLEDASPSTDFPKASTTQRTYPPSRRPARPNPPLRSFCSSSPPYPSTSTSYLQQEDDAARADSLELKDSFVLEFERELTFDESSRDKANNNKENSSFARSAAIMEQAFNGVDIMEFEDVPSEPRTVTPPPEKVYDFWDEVTY